MSEYKFFKIIKITDSKDVKISSINTYKKNIIIGDTNGGLRTYEITAKNKLIQLGEIITKNKIDQILTLQSRNICLILTSGELLSANLPSLNNNPFKYLN